MNRTLLITTITALGLTLVPLAASAEDVSTGSATSETSATSGTLATPPHRIGQPPLEKSVTGTSASAVRDRLMNRASSTLPLLPSMRGNASSTAPGAAVREEKKNSILLKAQEKADQEISRRIESLQTFAERIGNVHMSDADKSALQATMQEQINNLITLKEQIDSDTSTTTLKSAVQSITKSYRIYALVIPQGAITAAADRVNQIVSQMQALSAKLATRISDAKNAGNDVTTISSALTDLNAKVADAASQAAAAVSLVNALKPDNGDQATLKANKAALADAHKKIQAAQKDLQDARHDADSIVKGLKAFGSTSTTTASSTTSTTAQ